MVLELDTGWCAIEDAVSPERGWTPGGVPTRMLSLEGGGGHEAVC